MNSEFEIVAGELHAKLVVGSHSWASGQRAEQHPRRPHWRGGRRRDRKSELRGTRTRRPENPRVHKQQPAPHSNTLCPVTLPFQHNEIQKEAARDGRSLAASVRVLWRCPTLPQPVGCSTIGAAGLSFQVRNGCWAFPRCYDHHKFWCSTRSPHGWWGCGLIVVCIVVAAVLAACFVVHLNDRVGAIVYTR